MFIIPEGSFEPIVIFFGLMNSAVIFQIMINEFLRDLINTREVASFIDNVIVGMEEEDGHDKVVEEVIKRIEENDLYMKPEKFKWKVREVRFLEVVIRLECIKMEKVKIKTVLDWPVPKIIKMYKSL